MDINQMLEKLLHEAKQGDASSLNSLGLLYYLSDQEAGDKIKAKNFFQLAAEQGHAEAQFWLGKMYYMGVGVTEDKAKAKAKAVRWYRLSAEQGWAEAQFKLGFMYDRGLGLACDKTEAAKWYLLSYKTKIRTQYNMPSTLGEGLTQDIIEAEKFIRLFAD